MTRSAVGFQCFSGPLAFGYRCRSELTPSRSTSVQQRSAAVAAVTTLPAPAEPNAADDRVYTPPRRKSGQSLRPPHCRRLPRTAFAGRRAVSHRVSHRTRPRNPPRTVSPAAPDKRTHRVGTRAIHRRVVRVMNGTTAAVCPAAPRRRRRCCGRHTAAVAADHRARTPLSRLGCCTRKVRRVLRTCARTDRPTGELRISREGHIHY